MQAKCVPSGGMEVTFGELILEVGVDRGQDGLTEPARVIGKDPDIRVSTRAPATDQGGADHVEEEAPAPLAVPEPGDSVLQLGKPWVLATPTQIPATLELETPRALRYSKHVTIQRITPKAVWLSAPGVIAWVDRTAEHLGETGARWYGAASDAVVPLALGSDNGFLALVGGRIISCSGPGQCEARTSTRYVQQPIVAGDQQWLLVGRKNKGIFRWASPTSEPHLLIDAPVMNLCPTGQGAEAWGVIVGPAGERIVAVSADAPTATLYAPREILARALLSAEEVTWQEHGSLVAHLLQSDSAHWRATGHALALRAHADKDLTIRAHAAKGLVGRHGSRAVAALWLLAHDEADSVRWQTLEALEGYCSEKNALFCTGLLAAFFDDPLPAIAWRGRDALLGTAPAAALDGAERDYKLDLIARLTVGVEAGNADSSRRALLLLGADEDPQVRSLALMISARTTP